MRTHVLAVLAALLLLLGLGAGTAAAGEPVQAVGQEASSQQSASSGASAVQTNPTNRNVDVRIFSPGDGGAVEQTNAAGAQAVAGNANATDQAAAQAQSGAGTQAVGQDASNHQSADASAGAVQVKPTNDNVSVRIDSPGDGGSVQQTNAAEALAKAGNANQTTQSAGQEQGGGCEKCGGSGVQAAGQSADSKQKADADAEAVQVAPSNRNVSVRIGSPGDGGKVEQTNAAEAIAKAGNGNETTQSAGQTQGGGGCKCGGGGEQAVGQDASNHQSADADAKAVQLKPSNDNVSVRIHSRGDDGDVRQQNVAGAGAAAGNANETTQAAEQEQDGGSGVQAIGQDARSHQDADADATAVQLHPTNSNTAVRIGSPGSSGDVSQSNVALAGALAGNANETTQYAAQSQDGAGCKCGGSGVQAVGQRAKNVQWADADADAVQYKPSNHNTAVDLGGHAKKKDACGCDGKYDDKSHGGKYDDKSHGGKYEDKSHGGKYDDKSHGGKDDDKSHGGSVEQANVAAALGVALNKNRLGQDARQSQSGHSCKCGGDGVQAAGQSAHNGQSADSYAGALQDGAKNANTAGAAGWVRQINAALASSLAANLNATSQEVTQTQS